MVNLQAAPYYDDYDEAKGFYKILFRPSVAVQARELNQMQTVLQKQIERFGTHFFKEGSIVLGGGEDPDLKTTFYIKATKIGLSNNLEEIRANFVNRLMIGQNSNVQGVIIAAEYDADIDNYVFMVRYTASSGNDSVFRSTEEVVRYDFNETTQQYVKDTNYKFVVASGESSGRGSVYSIEQGAVFFRGYFIAFASQTIVLDKYSYTPTYTVGLKFSESIVTENIDNTLLDNALGTYNENAPGAHRYKVDASLVKLPYGTGSEDPDFVEILSINNGVVEENKKRPDYNILQDELAKRTYDESGDYYVKGLNVITREHLEVNNNEGLYPLSQGGNSQLISIDIDPGTAYVKGYERNFGNTQHIVTQKSVDFLYVNESSMNARSGGYIIINEIIGSPILDNGATISLYGEAQKRVSNSSSNLSVPSFPSPIGTARVKGIVYESGVLGEPSGRMRLYLYDINLPSTSFNLVRSVGLSGEFFADVVLFGNPATYPTVFDQNQDRLLFYVGSDYVKSLQNSTGESDTSFFFQRTTDGGQTSLNFNGGSTGNVNISFTADYETMGYSEGTLSTAEKREIVLSVKNTFEVTQIGTISVTGNVVTADAGSGTIFQTVFQANNQVRINGNIYTVSQVTSDTVLQLAETIGGGIAAGNTISRVFRSGEILDLTKKGSTGLDRTAQVTNGVLNINVQERNSTVTNVPIRVSYKVRRTATINAEIKKDLVRSAFLRVNCANIANTAAPINIGIPDVFKLKSVRRRIGSPFTDGNVNQAGVEDITERFVFDNGQRDNIYDHARIIPVSGSVISNVAGASSQHLLVEFDHFTSDFSSGFGYFSVDSYPVDDTGVDTNKIFTYEIPVYKSTSGVDYNLRNVMDFRPYKSNTVVSSTTINGSNTGASYSATGPLKVEANGLRLPVPDSIINLDYSYYLARRDAVVLDKNGVFSLIRGQPAIFPVSPSIPDNVMAVAQVYIAPFPSISEKLGRILKLNDTVCISNQVANIRYTMREIGVLKNRIENLEYYTALTLLEKSAVDLQIVDENGLDRFKNGFFVDGFLDHSLGANYLPDYNIAVDKIEQSIRPVFETDAFKYDYLQSSSSGVTKTGSLVTLPYTEVTLLDQSNVTGIRNIEQSVYRFVGVMQLTPDGDVWVDTKTVDKTIEFGNGIAAQNSMSTEYGSWQTYVTGYNLYDRSFGDRSGVPNQKQFVGSYTSYAAALAAAQKDKDGRFLIETVTGEQRTNVNTIVTTETQKQEIGSFVTSASLIPYIRPQVIRILVQGLKASTRYYTFFDNTDMNDYITPYTITDNAIDGAVIGATEGAEWRSDEYGNLLGLLRLPAEGKKFRTGTKEIIITDSPTNSVDATSYSKGYFTAQGLAVQKQNTILSTKTAVTTQEEVIETGRKKQTTEIFGPSCMAYSFKVDVPSDEEGVFLTSVDVFIENMHPTLGVWFEIREVNSAGGITRNQLPYSEVWMKRNDPRIKLNPFDANRDYNNSPLVPTRVNFPSPVFLYNNTQYAFVIHTEGLNPDTYFYVSRIGENDLRTGTQVTSRRLTGTLYTTNNNLNYNMVEGVDLTVRFNRANFNIGSGTVVFGNKPTEFFTTNNASGLFGRNGETVYGSEKIVYSNYQSTGNTIVVGDKVVGASVTGTIRAISGSSLFTDGFGFSNNEPISIINASDVAKNITAKISSVSSGVGAMRQYSSANNLMILDDSNGLFFANCKIKGEISANTADIFEFTNFPYSTTNLKPHYLTFSKTNVIFEKNGYVGNNTSGAFYGYVPGAPDASTDYETEAIILSRFHEINNFNSSPSSLVRATISSTSNYVSPVIDSTRANAIYVHNIINDPVATIGTELQPSGGDVINKYISKTVTLADGQDAEDLVVKLSAYRPPGSTVRVWMKVKNAQDGTPFEQRPWIEMNFSDVFSSKANKNNFVEITYTVDPAYLNNGIVEYISGGIAYTGFKQFAIKIGLLGTDSAIVPRVGDLRAIALQK